MRQAQTELDRLGIDLLVVTFEGRAEAVEYRAETATPWPVLSDPDRQLYEAYGLGRARWRHLWGLATMRAYAGEAWQGRFPRIPRADTVQQGGNVLIDPDGIVRYHHVGRGPADRPSVDALLAAARADRRSGRPPD